MTKPKGNKIALSRWMEQLRELQPKLAGGIAVSTQAMAWMDGLSPQEFINELLKRGQE